MAIFDPIGRNEKSVINFEIAIAELITDCYIRFNTSTEFAMALNVSEQVALLGAGKGAKFAGITYRSQKVASPIHDCYFYRTKSKYTVSLKTNYEKMVKADIKTLGKLMMGFAPHSMEWKVAMEMIASMGETLRSHSLGQAHPMYALADVRLNIPGLPGIWVHKETGALYVDCVVLKQSILEPGTTSPLKSKPETVIKAQLRKALRTGKYRTMVIKRISRIATSGNILEIDAEDE